MKFTIILTLIAIATMIVACGGSSQVCPDGTIVDDLSDCPKPVAPPVVPPEVAPAPVVPEPEPQLELDEDAITAQGKAAKMRNYKFSYSILPENHARRTYFIRGDFVKIELYTMMTRDAGSYDVVYLDTAQEKAVAYCGLGNPIVCPEPEQVIERPDYEEYEIVLPHELIADLTNAERVGSLTYENHDSYVFRYEEGGMYHQLYVQKFFGIPLRDYFFDNSEFSGEPGGIEFRDMAFNSVSALDVTPPGGW